MLNLKPEDMAILRAILQKHVPNMTVWAYGSRIRGQAHEGSDLDLVVCNPLNLDKPQTDLSDLRSALTESDLPILVDVLDWAEIPAAFREEIKRNHVLIWEKE